MLSVLILLLGSLWRHLLGDVVVGELLLGAVVSVVVMCMVGVVRLVTMLVLLLVVVVGCMGGGQRRGRGGRFDLCLQ